MLKYRTIENSTPIGKPKVFFTCHPNDCKLYFDVVAEDIFALVNCAIWYEEECRAGNDPKEMDLTLGSMQLFVIAVTRRFLREINDARDVLLPYAKAHGIPVLPILVETDDNLWADFNRESGGLQLLDRTDTDETSIDYEEKLEKFLKSVLIDDRLAALIRDAFDAYVFLSYRKKDRKYANELMSRIHENRRFRDIAIWFDEYLIPGESFTTGIEEAMEKSPIFAMAVTPHLLEPKNYVMEHEYKDARKAKKIIVPVEMVPTDHDEMTKSYEDLPAILKFGKDRTEEERFHERFMEALNRAAITKSDDTPEHNFYIGLAYLSGIDVEVNRDRAVFMIKDSSDLGCMAATQKLVYMYRNGEGVARDSKKELEYQYRLVEQRKNSYDAHPDIDLHLGTTTRYFRALLDLSDMLRERQDLDGAVTQAEKALCLYDELVIEVGRREADRDKAAVCNRLGGIYRKRKMLTEAKKNYMEALAIYEGMREEITTRRARRDLSISYEKIGSIEKVQKLFGEALESYKKAETLRKTLVEEKPDCRARRDYSVICTALGSVYKHIGDEKNALRYYEMSYELDKELEAELKTVSAKRDLSISAENLGRIFHKKGMTEKAITLLEKTVQLREEIYRKTGNDRHKEELDYAREKLERCRY